jgi:ubiquitin C-terminal hydrolase
LLIDSYFTNFSTNIIMSDEAIGDLFGFMEAELAGTNDGGAAAYYPMATDNNSAEENLVLSRPSTYYSPRPLEGYVGLDNQGSSCYLNSLLQAFYMTPEFRSALYSLNDQEIGTAKYEIWEQKEAEKAKIKKEKEETAEKPEEPDASIVQSLASEFGFEVGPVRAALRKFPRENQREQAIEYILTHDFSADPPEEQVAAPRSAENNQNNNNSAGNNNNKKEFLKIPIEFRRLFSYLQLTNQQSVSTYGLTSSFGWNTSKHNHAHIQHDIHELYTQLVEALQVTLGNTTQNGLIQQLFQGKLRTEYLCLQCAHLSAREELFYSLHAQVKGLKSLNSSLNYFTQPELLDGPNKKTCYEGCKAKTATKLRQSVAKLPKILTFALNRHEYDRKTWNRVKVADKFAFPRLIDMEIYTTEYLEQHSGGIYAENYKPSVEELIAQGLSEEKSKIPSVNQPINAAESEAKQGEHETREQSKDNKPNKQQKKKNKKNQDENAGENELFPLEQPEFDKNSPNLFELFAVIIHAGSAHGGHYYAYIREILTNHHKNTKPSGKTNNNSNNHDHEASNENKSKNGDVEEKEENWQWHRFNDSRVSSIDESQLGSQYGGKRECAYMLLYRHKSLSKGPNNSQISSTITVPTSLASVIELHNAQLAAERLEYERLHNQIKICLYLEQNFVAIENNIYPAELSAAEIEDFSEIHRKSVPLLAETAENNQNKQQKSKKQLKEEEKLQNDRLKQLELERNQLDRAENSSTEETQTQFSFIVDQRDTVAQFLSLIRAKIPQFSVQHIELNSFEATAAPPYRLEGSLPLYTDESKTLQELQLRNGEKLLIWDGQQLNHEPFYTGIKQEKQLRLKFSWFDVNKGPNPAADRTISLPATSTVHNLFLAVAKALETTEISAETGFSPLVLSIFTKRGAVETINYSLEKQRTLREIELQQNSWLAGEFSESNSNSLAKSWYIQRGNSVKLVIHYEKQQFEQNYDKNSSLLQLKRSAAEKFDLISVENSNLAQFRLRKLIGSDRKGGILAEESKNLRELGLDEDDCAVLLEIGPVPAENQLELLVTAVDSSQNRCLDAVSMLFDRKNTVKQVKSAILAVISCELAENSFVLYRGDLISNSKDKFFASEYINLGQLRLNSGDFVWLEPGILPIQGKITLECFLHTPSIEFPQKKLLKNYYLALKQQNFSTQSDKSNEIKQTNGENGKKSTQDAEKSETKADLATDSTNLAAVQPVSQLTISSTKNSNLSPLFSLDFSSNSTLLELKQALFNASPLLSALSSTEQIRIRLLTKADSLGRLAAADHLSLKKQNLNGNKKIAVQILAEEEKESELSEFAIFLRVCVALPLHNSVDYGPFPLPELVFDPKNDFPQLSQLKSWGQQLLGLETNNLAVIKWFSNEKSWKLLWENGVDPTEIKENNELAEIKAEPAQNAKKAGKLGKVGGEKPQFHLRMAPYNLHEHDLIAIVPLESFGVENLADFSKILREKFAPPSWIVLKETEPGSDPANNAANKKDKKARTEIALTIDY